MPQNLTVTEVSRPQPGVYFGPPDRGFLNWDTLLWRFAAEHSYWLATSAPRPHTMPVWGVWLHNSFQFSTYPQSRKAQNLRANPFANVHAADPEAVMILECNVTEVTQDADLQAFVDEYNPKYAWDFDLDQVRNGVFALVPHTAFAWAAGAGEKFHNTATRWRFAST